MTNVNVKFAFIVLMIFDDKQENTYTEKKK